MKCLSTMELKKLLDVGCRDDLSAAYEHVCSCQQCRAALRKLAGHSAAAVGLAESVFGIADCPDYEVLSRFAEQNLDTSIADAVQAHLGSCEQCARDVGKICELRSIASLREVVEVRFGASAANRLPMLRRVFAGVAIAGAAAAIVLAVLPAIKPSAPRPPAVAVAPPSVKEPEGPETPVAVKPDTRVNPAVPIQPQPATPTYKVVLVDGRYQIAKSDGKLVVLRSGSPVSVPRGVMARIVQKVATGRVALAQRAAVAITAVRVRDSEGYVPPPTAAKLIAPVGKIVLTERPELQWSKVQLAHSYRVTIRDAAGNTVYDASTTDPAHRVATDLPRGRVYTWQVGVRFNENDDWTLSRVARFEVLSDADAAVIRQASRSMPGSHLALAVAYESLGLKDEAAREYNLLRRANPGARF